jgi:hypothetical protein
MIWLLLLACADTRAVRGAVTDVWGNPIADATVVLEGIVERYNTDGSGHFDIETAQPVRRILVGKDGYIKGVAEPEAPVEEDADYNPLKFKLYPKPPKPGFYGVGRNGYVPLDAAKVKVVGSEVRHYAGVREIPAEHLAAGKARFVFQTTLRPSEISQMNLHLSRLVFVDKTPMKGLLGEEAATVNLWTAEEEVPFDLTEMPAENEYLIETREALEPGVYAFHALDILNETDQQVILNLPRERQVAFPFEVG